MGERLASLVNRQELFARRQYEPVIAHDALGNATSTWFGVGVAADAASCGLPVDVLILVFAQEMVRRELGHPTSTILIADSNACDAGSTYTNISIIARKRIAQNTIQIENCQTNFPNPISLGSNRSKEQNRYPAAARQARSGIRS